MSEHKWTPGPWVHVGEWEVMGPEGDAVASCNTFEDARLIAAAPELLEATKRMVSWADDWYSGKAHPIDDLKCARAAIAKATGGK